MASRLSPGHETGQLFFNTPLDLNDRVMNSIVYSRCVWAHAEVFLFGKKRRARAQKEEQRKKERSCVFLSESCHSFLLFLLSLFFVVLSFADNDVVSSESTSNNVARHQWSRYTPNQHGDVSKLIDSRRRQKKLVLFSLRLPFFCVCCCSRSSSTSSSHFRPSFLIICVSISPCVCVSLFLRFIIYSRCITSFATHSGRVSLRVSSSTRWHQIECQSIANRKGQHRLGEKFRS